MAPQDNSVSVLAVTSILNALAELGLSMAACSATESVAQLAESERVGSEVREEVWAFAEMHSSDPHIGLAAGLHMTPGALGAVDYLLRSAKTLRETMNFAARYVSLLDSGAVISIVEANGELTVLRFARSNGEPWLRQDIECLFRVVLSVVKARSPEVAGLGVRFAHKEVAPLAAYAEAFSDAPEFGCAHNEMWFPNSMLDLTHNQADPKLAEILKEHVEGKFENLPSRDLADEVRRAVAVLLPQGRGTLDAVALALGVSPRTLRRRLSEIDISFRAIVEDFRKEFATAQLLRSGRTIKEIANALGFSDQSTFQRAFRRWFGMSAGEYRSTNQPSE